MRAFLFPLITIAALWRTPVAQRQQHSAVSLSANSVQGGDRPQVELRYETLCPYCRRWIANQLTAAMEAFPDKFDMKLLPYGNVRVDDDGKYECQHGERECELNVVHACAIDALQPLDAIKFVICMEENTETATVAKCAPADHVGAITDCSEGPKGQSLWKAVAAESEKVPYKYVPWVTLNGVHSSAAEGDLVGALCDAGLKGLACAKQQQHLRLLAAKQQKSPPPHSNRFDGADAGQSS